MPLNAAPTNSVGSATRQTGCLKPNSNIQHAVRTWGGGGGGGAAGAAEAESKQLNERVSGEEEKLLYIIGGEGRGKAASASGQRLANDAYHGSPCEDSLGYFNDCIYIPGAAPRQTKRKTLPAALHLAA